jgi:hypothetical protein
LGDAGGGLTQQDAQQAACDGEADTLGLGGGDELGLRVGPDQDTEALGVLEGVKAGLQLAELLVEVGELSLVRCGVEATQGAVGLAVGAPAREAALKGVTADVAVSSEEDTGGAGEPLQRRYDARG